MTEFFDLIYSCRQSFNSLEELDDIYKKSQEAGEKIDASDKDRTEFVNQLVKLSGVLNVDDLIDMTDYLDSSVTEWENDRGQKRLTCLGVNYAVNEVYQRLQALNELTADNREKYEAFKKFLAYVKLTEGRVVRNGIKGLSIDTDELQKNMMTDAEIEDLLMAIEELKNTAFEDRNLFRLVRFANMAGFDGIKFNDVSKEKYTVNISQISDIMVIVPILEKMNDLQDMVSMTNVKMYALICMANDADTDKQFIEELSKENRASHVITTVDFRKLAESVTNIDNGHGTTFIDNVTALIDDKSFFAANAGDAASLSSAITTFREATDEQGRLVSNSDDAVIKNQSDAEKLQKGLSLCAGKILETAAENTYAAENSILDYKTTLTDDFEISVKDKNGSDTSNAITVNVDEAVAKWKAFLNQDVFKTDFSKHLKDDINMNHFKDTDFDAGDYAVLKKKPADILDVIKKIDTAGPKKCFKSIKTLFDNPDTLSNADRLKASVDIIKCLRKFFECPFQDIRPEMKDISKKYYDAACQLVYYKERSIKESFGTVADMMIFERVVLVEKKDYTAYFKKLADKVKDYLSDKKGRSIITFVTDDAADAAHFIKPDNSERQSDEQADDTQPATPAMSPEITAAEKAVAAKADEFDSQKPEVVSQVEQHAEELRTPSRKPAGDSNNPSPLNR